MGLKCSLLGHAYEPADVERDREERGSEVVTVVRELERCRRCDAERVVSESTEVTAVVDPEDVGLDESATTPGNDTPKPDDETTDADATAADRDGETAEAGAFDGIVERSGALADDDDEPSERRAEATVVDDDPDGSDENDTEPDVGANEPETPRSPEEEDAEILTETSTPRAPGRWPDDPVGEPWEPGIEEEDGTDTEAAGGRADDEGRVETSADDDDYDEPRAGVSVPDGPIGCPECGFAADPESSYRDGDSCPECGAWLRVERNR